MRIEIALIRKAELMWMSDTRSMFAIAMSKEHLCSTYHALPVLNHGFLV